MRGNNKLNYLVAEALDTALSDRIEDLERACARIASRERISFDILAACAHAALAECVAIESYRGGCIS